MIVRWAVKNIQRILIIRGDKIIIPFLKVKSHGAGKESSKYNVYDILWSIDCNIFSFYRENLWKEDKFLPSNYTSLRLTNYLH